MDDLISEFITETSASLAVLERSLTALAPPLDDPALLDPIVQLVHTIKGTCGFLGLKRLESLAHAGENALSHMRHRAEAVTGDRLQLVRDTTARIAQLVTRLADDGREAAGDDAPLIERLTRFTHTGDASPGTTTASVEHSDALERAFADASTTVEGWMDFTRFSKNAPSATISDEASTLSDHAKEIAIQQGLATASPTSQAAVCESVQVRRDLLDQLRDTIGALARTRHQWMHVARADAALQVPLHQLSRLTAALQKTMRQMPYRSSTVPALVIVASSQTLAIPQREVLEIVPVGGAAARHVEKVGNATVLRFRHRLLPVMRLGNLLRLPQEAEAEGEGYVAVVRAGGSLVGVLLDRVEQVQEILVKPLRGLMGACDLYAGAALLDDGRVALVLHPPGLAPYFGVTGNDAAPLAIGTLAEPPSSAMRILLFNAGAGIQKAIPLAQVTRVETMEQSAILRNGRLS